MANNLKVLRSK